LGAAPNLSLDEDPAPADRLSADELFALADGVDNYRVKPGELWQATIAAPGEWDLFGDGVAGTMRLGHRTRGELTFRFRGTTDMRRAIEQLGGVWADCLSVNATWDRQKKKFVRSE
jgi:hypothetical protein